MPLIIGTAGHIDHGKTSLIKALTGIDTDRLKEERERGISIDLGFAYFDLPDGTRCGIVDVPGHERFIRNMLAGATGIDLVLFVVAADDGIMPQTREHLDIMHLLGIKSGIFVITKSDLADKERIDKVLADIKELAQNTCIKDSPAIPVSSATGAGMDNLKILIAQESKKILPKTEGGFCRLPIDRSFSMKGFGAVVTGTIASGVFKKNDEAVIISKHTDTHKKVKIRGIQSHFDQADMLVSGQRAAINLSGISHAEIERGDVLASADLDMVGRFFDVCFEFLPSMKRPVKNHSTFKLHHMTDETVAQVLFAGMKEAGPGVKAYGQIKLKEPMAMMRGDRFILRDSSIDATIGGGSILLPLAKMRKLMDAGQYQVLDSQDLRKVLVSILSGKDSYGIDCHTIRLMLNLSEKEFKKVAGSNEEIAILNGRAILKININNIEQYIVNAINKYHTDMPSDVGADEDYIIKQVISQGSAPAGFKHGSEYRSQSAIFKTILDGLVSSGKIVKTGNVFHLSSHKPKAKGIDKEIEDAILLAFSNRHFEPVKLDKALKSSSCKKEDIKKVFQLLIKRGIVIKVTEDSYISQAKLDKAKDKLIRWFADNGKIKAAEFRDVLGCGRKFAIELLEYFDKERLTLRSGDYRVLRKTLSAKQ